MRERHPAPSLPLLAFFVFALVACFLALVTETPDHLEGEVVTIEIAPDRLDDGNPYTFQAQPDAPLLEPQPWPEEKP